MGILGITFQDLRFRARQFLIAVIGAGLVFAMGLLLSGMVAGLGNEITHTVEAARADSWPGLAQRRVDRSRPHHGHPQHSW